MPFLSSSKQWSNQAHQQQRDRKIAAAVHRHRMVKARRDNLKHAINHPVSHGFGKLFGR